MTHASDGVRKRVDGKIRGAARIVHRINGESTRQKGEAWLAAQKKKLKKRF